MTRPATVIPADEWDTLEFVAEAYGGVGCGLWTDHRNQPCCLVGMAQFAELPGVEMGGGRTLGEAYRGIYFRDVDRAHDAVGTRLYGAFAWHERVPFPDLAAELHLVRGD